MQYVKLNVHCPNNSYTQQTNNCKSKLSKKNMDNQNKEQKPSTNKHLKKTNSPSSLA
jgi:hypothetical protein